MKISNKVLICFKFCTLLVPMSDLVYSTYSSEESLPAIIALIQKDLSEPYSVFTYRYFVNRFPNLCEMVHNGAGELIAVVVCKIDPHEKSRRSRGYIGMLAVRQDYRKQQLGSKLVSIVLDRMKQMGADECVLEAEESNKGALSLYRRLGFVRTKYLRNYYLSGSDAYRLKKLFTPLVVS